MNDAGESELHRLAAELEQIDLHHPLSDSQREALKKASMALSIVFSHNLRQTLEQRYDYLGKPLDGNPTHE